MSFHRYIYPTAQEAAEQAPPADTADTEAEPTSTCT